MEQASTKPILDTGMLIRLDLSDPTVINDSFASNRQNLAHLASQLLLYPQIILPSYDMGIVPVLIKWLGSALFQELLKEDAIVIARRRGILAYNGGLGIGTIVIEAGEKPLPWSAEALFSETARSAELQFANLAGGIATRVRSQLLEQTMAKTRDFEIGNKFFMDHIVNESYTDVMQSPQLARFVHETSQKGKDGGVDLTQLPQVASTQSRVLRANGNIDDAADLVLRVAEINLGLVLADQYRGADIRTSAGAESLLQGKLARANVPSNLLGGFIQLQELNKIPDIRPAIADGELETQKIWEIRQSSAGRKFRDWLHASNKKDPRELEQAYVEAISKAGIGQSLPVRVIRLAATASVGALLAGIPGLALGLGADALDSFFLERWLAGYSPKIFFDKLQKLMPKQKE